MASTSTPTSAAPSASDMNDGRSRLAGHDSDELVSRVAQGLHDTVDRLANTAGPAVHKLEEGVSRASETVHGQAHRAHELGDQLTDSLRDTVREHPLASLMMALAAGMLLARISR